MKWREIESVVEESVRANLTVNSRSRSVNPRLQNQFRGS